MDEKHRHKGLREAEHLLDEVLRGSPHPELGGLPDTLKVLGIKAPETEYPVGLNKARRELAQVDEEREQAMA